MITLSYHNGYPQLTQSRTFWGFSLSPIQQKRCINIMGVRGDNFTWNNNLLNGPCIMITMSSQVTMVSSINTILSTLKLVDATHRAGEVLCTNTNIMGVTEDDSTQNNIFVVCIMITIYSHNDQPYTAMKDQICSLKQRGDRTSMGIDKSWSINGDYLFNKAQIQASQATIWMSWHISNTNAGVGNRKLFWSI